MPLQASITLLTMRMLGAPQWAVSHSDSAVLRVAEVEVEVDGDEEDGEDGEDHTLTEGQVVPMEATVVTAAEAEETSIATTDPRLTSARVRISTARLLTTTLMALDLLLLTP